MNKMAATFTVNGTRRDLVVDSNALLSEVLRDDLDLHGVHTSCGSGDCGACTVLVDGEPVLACLTLALNVRDKEILTIEGLANGKGLHALQQAFVDGGAVQCGYCTPGMILSCLAFIERTPSPTWAQVKEGIAGNLCRCTGYNKIVDAVLQVANGGN